MIKWLLTQWAGVQTRCLQREQDRKLAKRFLKEQAATAAFMFRLGERMRRESLPPRCVAVYEMILKWSQDDPIKIKQAALYLFLWELEEKKTSIHWEVSDIVLEIEKLEKVNGDLAIRKNQKAVSTE